MLGCLAWVFALACRISMVVPLPGNPFDMGLFVFPAAWLLCIFLTLKFRRRTFGFYWWVYCSAPYALSYWLLILVSPFWFSEGPRLWRLVLPF